MIKNIDSEDIKQYLTAQKKEEILQLFASQIAEIMVNIDLFPNNEFVDSEGYIVGGSETYGRYEGENNKIKINEDAVAHKIDCMQQYFCRQPYRYSKEELFCFVDLCVLHECVHAYQHQVVGREMRRNDYELENEAYEQSKRIFEKNYTNISEQVREKVLNEYEKDFNSNEFTN